MDPLEQYLSTIHCSDELFPGHGSGIVHIFKNSSLGQALKLLIDHKILSLPVIELETRQLIGVLSMLDILHVILSFMPEEEWKKWGQENDESFNQLLTKRGTQISHAKVSVFFSQMVQDFLNLDPVYTLVPKSSLLEAIRLMVHTQTHRVVIVQGGRLINMVTQSRALELIRGGPSLPELEIPLKDTVLGSECIKPVHYISVHDIAWNAFKLMKEKAISSLAVVNELGTLVGAISASDLKLLSFDLRYLNLLTTSVKEFLHTLNHSDLSKEVRKSQLIFLHKDPVLKCSVHFKLGDIVDILCNFKVHRVYVVDINDKPIGVVSIHDILAEILRKRNILHATKIPVKTKDIIGNYSGP